MYRYFYSATHDQELYDYAAAQRIDAKERGLTLPSRPSWACQSFVQNADGVWVPYTQSFKVVDAAAVIAMAQQNLPLAHQQYLTKYTDAVQVAEADFLSTERRLYPEHYAPDYGATTGAQVKAVETLPVSSWSDPPRREKVFRFFYAPLHDKDNHQREMDAASRRPNREVLGGYPTLKLEGGGRAPFTAMVCVKNEFGRQMDTTTHRFLQDYVQRWGEVHALRDCTLKEAGKLLHGYPDTWYPWRPGQKYNERGPEDTQCHRETSVESVTKLRQFKLAAEED
jgi:hypothetical protein